MNGVLIAARASLFYTQQTKNAGRLHTLESTSRHINAIMPTRQPKALHPSWQTIPLILSMMQSYNPPVEWFYYLTYISHMLCKSKPTHIARANLMSLLRARPIVQMWHEAPLSEIYDGEEPNLPLMLEETNVFN
jgi:hypothetical protein